MHPPEPAMNNSLGLHLVFFALVAALLVGVAMGIHPKAPAELAPICSARTPARAVQAWDSKNADRP